MRVGAGVDGEVAGEDGRGQGDNGPAAGCRHAEGGGVVGGEADEAGGRWERVGDREPRVSDSVAGGPDEGAEDGAGAGDRDLLTDDRADGELEAVDRAGDAEAGRLGDEGSEQAVGAEQVIDGDGIGVEVEEVTRPGDRRGQIPEVVEHEDGVDGRAVTSRSQGDRPVAVGKA